MKNKIYKSFIFILFTAIVLMWSDTSALAVAAAKTAPLSLKSTVIKFVIAMGAVAISSILLYAGLKIYNNIREKMPNKKNPVKNTRSEFDTPETVDDAVDFFINHNRL